MVKAKQKERERRKAGKGENAAGRHKEIEESVSQRQAERFRTREKISQRVFERITDWDS